MSTVLIVEDDRANREVFGKILTRAGYTVETAENGLDALELLDKATYDAIVCDIAMPLLSGIGLYEQLEERYPRVTGRILFVTAYSDDPRVRAFLKGTGRPVMEKPVGLAALVEAVRRITG